MRRGIVHIGLPRTGTSSFQDVLHRRRAALAAAGVLYPDLAAAVPGADAGNHKLLGEVLDGRRPAAEGATALAALDRALAATGADVAILSYEGLVRMGPRIAPWRTLSAALARHGFAMEVLLTVKAQGEYLNSLYTLRVRRLDEGRRFGAFAAAMLRHRPLDYATMAVPWRDAASGRLRAVPLADRRSPAPLVERIFAELGLLERVRSVLAAEDLAVATNRSPGPVAIEVARRLHLRGAKEHLRERAQHAAREAEALALARGLDAAVFDGVGPALGARIAGRFAAANDRFADMAWGCPWPARSADRAPGPSNEIGGRAADPATEAAIVAITDEIARRFALPAGSGRLWPGWRRAAAALRRYR
ncbi:MAG TPA: hypothetical protein VHD15_16180 [Hyphomicrobiales bacterium]|nr:hypothetical protein [Hyphomicrobiales bacterium]